MSPAVSPFDAELAELIQLLEQQLELRGCIALSPDQAAHFISWLRNTRKILNDQTALIAEMQRVLNLPSV